MRFVTGRLAWRMIAVAVIVGVAYGCAESIAPPGGPPRKDPPDLITLLPESNSVNVKTSRAVFGFDEVVSERPAGGGEDLSTQFLISPKKGDPKVAWHRDHFSVAPRGGYSPNTAYTITMLPGISDLHGNTVKKAVTLTFSTGPTIPTTVVRGRMFDWVSDRIAPSAYIDMYQLPIAPKAKDTVDYVTVVDTTGAFVLRHAPPGSYRVRGYVDQNTNRKLDANEIWDTVTIKLTDSAQVELLGFVHDTIGPHIHEITVRDTTTIRITFDQPIALDQPLQPDLFSITAKDSSHIPVAKVLSGPAYDSLRSSVERKRADSIVRADSLRRVDSGRATRDTSASRRRRELRQEQRDSVARAKIPHPSRPIPYTDMVLILGSPLQAGTQYRLHVAGVHGLLNKTVPGTRSFTVPKALSPDSVHARSDTPTRHSPGAAAPPSRPSSPHP